MARNMQPVAKRCKTLGISPVTMGYSKKNTTRNSNNGMRKKQSEYGLQLNEKQKVKFIYGLLEKQFASYYVQATKMSGKTGDNLLALCEMRLDNVVFRLGFAKTRRQARQLVNHGHFTVDGRRVNIPSYQIKAGQVVGICEKSRSSAVFSGLTGEDAAFVSTPEWLELDKANLKGKILRLPERSDIDYDVEEHLIVEYYSR